MTKNGMRPVHPGEILREDFLTELNMSASTLARALHVPAPRINDIVRERRGITADMHCAWPGTLAEMPKAG